jgi:hypothetical protein
MSTSQSGGCPNTTNPYHECTAYCRLRYGLDVAAVNRAQVGAKVPQGLVQPNRTQVPNQHQNAAARTHKAGNIEAAVELLVANGCGGGRGARPDAALGAAVLGVMPPAHSPHLSSQWVAKVVDFSSQ